MLDLPINVSTKTRVVQEHIEFFTGQIVCTQPRRLAARALAARVAEEFGCEVGQEVEN